MVSKLCMLNISRWLLLVLFTLATFNSVNAEDKKFEVSNKIKSAKVIVGSDKKLKGSVTFVPADYYPTRKFNLIVGGCKLSVVATKVPGSDVIDFKFNNEKGGSLGSLPNPKSFLVQEQSLTFYHSNGDSGPMSCGTNFVFNPIEGQSEYTLEFKLDGDIPSGFALTSDNLLYDESVKSEDKVNVWLFVGISIGVGCFILFLVISSVAGGVYIFIKRLKKEAAAKEEVLKTAKEVSEQKDQTSAKSTKPAKKNLNAKATQKVSGREMKEKSVSESQQQTKMKPATEIQSQTEIKPKPVEETPLQNNEEKRNYYGLTPADYIKYKDAPVTKPTPMNLWVRGNMEREKQKEQEARERAAMKTGREKSLELSKTQTIEKTARERMDEKTASEVSKTQDDKSH